MQLELDGHTYRIDAMPAMVQFHVMRKIGPVLSTLTPVIEAMNELQLNDDPDLDDLAVLSQAAQPLAYALASLPDDHATYIINSAMACVKRRDSRLWSAAWDEASASPMYADMTPLVWLTLVFHIIKGQIQPFLRGIATSLSAARQVLE